MKVDELGEFGLIRRIAQRISRSVAEGDPSVVIGIGDDAAAWATYRQALRDMPSNVSDPAPVYNDPTHSAWPLKPE